MRFCRRCGPLASPRARRRRVLSAAHEIGYLDPAAEPAQSAEPAADLAFIVPGGTNTFLKASDVMETEIELLGRMRNRLVAEA